VIILKGREEAVAQAIQTLRGIVDRERFQRREEEEEKGGGLSIDLVRLRKADVKTVAALIQEVVPRGLEMILERPRARALIVQGERTSVRMAVSLARQLDGQEIHPQLRRLIWPRDEDGEDGEDGGGHRGREGDAPREGDRDAPREGEVPREGDPPADG
jgi:hypothetical protein